MGVIMMQDKLYCYHDSNILKNKLNIKDQNALDVAEELISYQVYVDALKDPIKGNLDFEHLKRVHRALFSDIYEWSGSVRTIDISKVNNFCPSQHIDSFASDIFRNLKKDKHLKGLSTEVFTNKFADYFSDLNALHPFREGNGRSLRLFMTYVAQNSGHKIEFRKINKENFMDACIHSMATGKSNLLVDVFKKIIDIPENDVQTYREWKQSMGVASKSDKIQDPSIDDMEL